MKESLVRIRLDGNGRVHRPEETLSGEYRLDGIAPEEIKAVEISVLWHTEGKGDEDLAVHDFRRLSVESGDRIDVRRPGRFSTVLPNSPLSYRGVIVKIHWCVRVRVFLARGREVLGEVPFRLGEVLPPRSATFWARARAAEEDRHSCLSPSEEDRHSCLSPEGLPSPQADPTAAGEGLASAGEEVPAAATDQPDSAGNGHSPSDDHPVPEAEATVP
jgi:hypothetical protein